MTDMLYCTAYRRTLVVPTNQENLARVAELECEQV